MAYVTIQLLSSVLYGFPRRKAFALGTVLNPYVVDAGNVSGRQSQLVRVPAWKPAAGQCWEYHWWRILHGGSHGVLLLREPEQAERGLRRVAESAAMKLRVCIEVQVRKSGQSWSGLSQPVVVCRARHFCVFEM